MIFYLLLITPIFAERWSLVSSYTSRHFYSPEKNINFVDLTFDPYSVDSLLELAVLSEQAYDHPNDKNWSTEEHFGWNESGLRGYVYMNEFKDLLVVFKGTDLTGETRVLDKYNNNLLFSCCCGLVDPRWDSVCECGQLSPNFCHTKCLVSEFWHPGNYLQWSTDVVNDITRRYLYRNLYFTGHSLGGALAVWQAWFTGNGSQAIAFSPPGTWSLVLKTMGFYQPPSENIWTLGSFKDPVFMGMCDSFGTVCYHAGYAIETYCQIGYRGLIDKDTNRDLNILEHRISWIIKTLQSMSYPPDYFLESKECLNEECGEWLFSEK